MPFRDKQQQLRSSVTAQVFTSEKQQASLAPIVVNGQTPGNSRATSWVLGCLLKCLEPPVSGQTRHTKGVLQESCPKAESANTFKKRTVICRGKEEVNRPFSTQPQERAVSSGSLFFLELLHPSGITETSFRNLILGGAAG